MNLKIIDNLGDFSFVIITTFVTFFLWYLFLGHQFVTQPYVWDDLHHIRAYSTDELINSWVDNWDYSGVETPSYRPVALIFYHLIGSFFGENYLFLRIFVFSLMIVLILQFNFLLLKLNFKRSHILIFSILIVFTKIYSTLLAWFTISALIYCYILTLISISLFIDWVDKKNNNLLFLSLIFAFLAIFTREELYILPGIIFLILIFKQKDYFKNFISNLSIFFLFFSLVVIHILLRKYFVSEGAHFEISSWSVKFGGETLGFGYLIKALKSSWLPMGYWSVNNTYFLQTLTFFIWTTSIISALIISIKYNKIKSLISLNSVVFLLTVFLLSLSNIVTGRAFGIFLPTLIVLLFVSVLTINLLKVKNDNSNILLKTICNFLFLSIIISGIIGGYSRSTKHIQTMNLYSFHIVMYDSIFIYGLKDKNLKIPKIRYESKRKHLQNLNVLNMNDAINLSKNNNPKILKTQYRPLSF